MVGCNKKRLQRLKATPQYSWIRIQIEKNTGSGLAKKEGGALQSHANILLVRY